MADFHAAEKPDSKSMTLPTLLVVICLAVFLVDGIGFFRGDGILIYLSQYYRATQKDVIIEIGSRSFLTLYIAIGGFLSILFFQFTPMKEKFNQDYRFSLAFTLIFIALALATVDQKLINAPFAGLGYSRCQYEPDVGWGKGRFSKIWFAKDPAKCPTAKDESVKVE